MSTGGKIRDLSGRRFTRLLVISFPGLIKHKALWLCRCDCGAEKVVAAKYLLNGDTKSCGCLLLEWTRYMGSTFEGRLRHGHDRAGEQTQTYRSWDGVIQRCTNPSNANWRHYGGRGIKVCERWLKFENFLADMGERPPSTSIERIDNDGNYEPSNCRWATPREQIMNRRSRARVRADLAKQGLAA